MPPSSYQRVAFVCCTHGNALAFRAVLDSIAERTVDAIVCLGDVATLGPEPRPCIELVRTHCDHFVRGNHDRYLLDPMADDPHIAPTPVRSAVEWCRSAVTDGDRAFLATSVETLRLTIGDHSVLAYHGSPRSDVEGLLPRSRARALRRSFDGRTADLFVGGHTHVQMHRRLRDCQVIAVGSVGMPFASADFEGQPEVLPHAEYAVVGLNRSGELRVELLRVGLDPVQLAAAAAAWDEPMGQQLAATYAMHAERRSAPTPQAGKRPQRSGPDY